MEKQSQQKKKLRILCFHGFGTNKDILTYQLRQFKKFFKNIEFVTIDGPFQISRSLVNDPSLIPLLEKTGQKCFSWLRVMHENVYVYLDQTMNYIIDFIKKEGPFDGVLGFSQGGMIASYFTYYCEFFEEKIKGWSKPKFTILISSGVFFPPQVKKKFIINTPSIHFIGENDFLFAKTLFISTLYSKPTLIFHKEGHRIPKMTEYEIGVMNDFFKNFEEKSREHRPKL